MSPEHVRQAFAVVLPDDEPPFPNGPEDYGLSAPKLLSEAPQATPSLDVIDPRAWEGVPVPPREWIVRDMIPAHTVSLLMGDGAAGKSTLSLQLAVARALGRDWIGTVPEAGTTLFLSAEDDKDELHRRVAAIVAHYGASFSDLAGLRLVDLVGQDAVLGTLQKDGRICATEHFRAVESYVETHKPDLVVVDALADAYAGDENNRMQARQFIGLLKGPSRKFGTTFLCLAHPSLSGMSSGSGTSGSTAWNNSVRSRLYFETAKATDGAEPDPDLRTLSVKKTNYGPRGLSFAVRWTAGAYVPEGSTSSLDRMALKQKAETTFLDLLRRFNVQGQDVSAKPCSTYAPKLFAGHPQADGIGKPLFAAAMQSLLDSNKIKIETTGPESRRRSRLVIGEL